MQELRAAAAVASALLSHGGNYLESDPDMRGIHTPGTERNERVSIVGEIESARKRILEVNDGSRHMLSSPGTGGDKSRSNI